MGRKILIFDIDKTIDSNCLKKGSAPLQKVLQIFNAAYTNNWFVYVITARRLNAFDNWQQLVTYSVPKEIIWWLFKLNEDVPHEYWLFYTQHDDEPKEYVRETLKRQCNPTRAIQDYRDFVTSRKLKSEGEIDSFNFGLFKMMQIETIARLHRLHKTVNPSFCYHDIYFFDDSYYNKLAWIFTVQYYNQEFEHVKFIGGHDKSVFKYITDTEFANVMKK